MLKKLILKNFRIHKKLILRFSPFVTTIVGSNYAGKSTVTRALKLIAKNKPSGSSYINWDSKESKVKLLYDNDNKVIRRRSSTKNSYQFNDQIFTAFGNEVPPPIIKSLNISDINFQGQHDAPFWFSLSSGEVSRQLNTIVNLGIIDDTLSNIDSQKRKINTILELSKERLNKAQQEKEKLAYIKDMNIDFEIIENLHEEKEEIAVGLITINELIENVNRYKEIKENNGKLAVDGKNLLLKGELYKQTTEKLEVLQELLKDIENQQKIANQTVPSLKSLKSLKDNVETVTKTQSHLNILITKIKGQEEEKNNAILELQTIKQQMKKEIGDTCPLCNQPMLK